MVSRTVQATIIVVVATAFALAIGGHTPIGQKIWPPTETPPGLEPTAAQLAGFMAYGVIEALAFGAGIAFLALGWPLVRRAVASRRLAVASYLAIGWVLVNWVPHDNLHMHVGMRPAGLLALEWGFHGTLIVAGLVLVTFFVRVAQGAKAGAATSATRTAPATTRA